MIQFQKKPPSICWLASLQAQAASSPPTSPTHGSSRSMPMPVRSTSAGSTPTHVPQDSLAGVGGDVQEAFARGEAGGIPRALALAMPVPFAHVPGWGTEGHPMG